MAIWRSEYLESVFNGPLDRSGITELALRSLGDSNAPENENIEFKSVDAYAKQPKNPDIRWRNDQELGKDVASFANHYGGIIVIGIEEKPKYYAGQLSVAGRTNAEEEHLRLGQALQENVSPAIRVDFIEVPTSDGSATVIVVPPSEGAPHGVRYEKSKRFPLCFPIRNEARTRYMHESELADRYRRRFLGVGDRRERERLVISDGIERLARSASDWLFVSTVPRVEASGNLNREQARRAEEWLFSLNSSGPKFSHSDPGRRPVAIPGGLSFTDISSDPDNADEPPGGKYFELHTRGSTFCAYELTGIGDDAGAIYDLHLADTLVLLTDVAIRWSLEQQGNWGSAAVIAGIVPGGQSGGPAPLELITYTRGGEATRVHGTRLVRIPPRATSEIDLSAVESAQQRMVVAYELGSSLMQYFGLPEIRFIAEDGSIPVNEWAAGANYRQVEAWANSRGIQTGNSTVSQSPFT